MKISKREDEWLDVLKTYLPNCVIKTYAPPGKQIGSSCGEFTKHYYHAEVETPAEYKNFLEWEKKHKIVQLC